MKLTKYRTLSPLAVLSLVLLFGVIGCSKSGKVTGKVTYGGETLPVGTINFYPEKSTGKQPIIVEIADGQFSVDKVPAGTYTVTVSTSSHRLTYENLKKAGEAGGPTSLTKMGGTAPNMQKKKEKGIEMPGQADIEKSKKEQLEKLEHMIDVPAKFGDPEKSGLQCEVKTGAQDITIEIPKS